MEGRYRFLGTGSSLGVPVVCCKCAVCSSTNEKNKRLRSSGLLQIGNKKILLDVGPDYRTQALQNGIHSLNGCLLTHAHYDHLGGFEDLKVYAHQGTKLPCLMLEDTFQQLKVKYAHLMRPSQEDVDDSPFFEWHRLKMPFGYRLFEGIAFEILSFKQVGMQVMGIRVGDFGYISDIKEYNLELITKLEGIGTLVISAPRKKASLMHFSLEDAIAFSRRVKAKKTYITHIAHELDHEETQKELPPSFFLAYDGLEIAFQVL